VSLSLLSLVWPYLHLPWRLSLSGEMLMCHECYKIALFCGLSPPLDKSRIVVTVRDTPPRHAQVTVGSVGQSPLGQTQISIPRGLMQLKWPRMAQGEFPSILPSVLNQSSCSVLLPVGKESIVPCLLKSCAPPPANSSHRYSQPQCPPTPLPHHLRRA
jgi:hypothetical protein